MLRRSHKKTRKGSKCEECRRRHIRCDQQRPSCINCQNSDRICTYKPTDQPRVVEASSVSNESSVDLTPPPPYGAGSRALQPTPSPSARAADDPLVNILHLELFNHFIQGTFLFIDKDTALTDQLKRTALSQAFSNPYLMHGILAFAARHISTQASPERSRYYLDQSTQLQTWALAKFNPAHLHPDRDTCVTLFLFSSLTCLHGLADIAFTDLDPEPFFIRFGGYFGLQRGVRTIISDYWPQLNESEIRPLLQWCEQLAVRKGQGSECDVIRQLVAQSTDMSPAAAEACNLAIEQIQCVLDGCSPRQLVPAHDVYIIFAWPFLVPEKMVDLLVLRRPVALIILAYYGAILDSCRDLWIVGEAGKNIVCAVRDYLGPRWASWLRWPCEVVGIGTL